MMAIDDDVLDEMNRILSKANNRQECQLILLMLILAVVTSNSIILLKIMA